MTPTTLCIGVFIVGIAGAVVWWVFRHLLGFSDEIAMFNLVVVGLREILGARLFFAGCGLLLFVSVNCMFATMLTFASLATCNTTNPSYFCNVLGLY